MAAISVVSPVYNAEHSIAELCRRTAEALDAAGIAYTIILVDDGSVDASWRKILGAARHDSRVVGVKLSRNFGQHAAITAGLELSKADWTVILDCDLQDRPEDIPQLYEHAVTAGVDMVTAVFASRSEQSVKRLPSRIFWALLSRTSGLDFNSNRGNFRILSRRLVEAILLHRESFRVLDAIAQLSGFSSSDVSLTRDGRFAGKSSYSFVKRVRLGIQLLIAYSVRPLFLVVGLGLSFAFGAFAVGVAVGILALMGRVQVVGWASVMVAIFFVGGIILASIGLLGLFIGQTYAEVRGRPLYIVQEFTSS